MICNIDWSNGKDWTSIIFMRKLADGQMTVEKDISLTPEETAALRVALITAPLPVVPVEPAGDGIRHCSGEALLSRLVDLYALEPLAVAVVCDKALDRSGALLGKVRNLHIDGKPAEKGR